MRHADQLLKLARGLPHVPVEKFNISMWGNGRLRLDTAGYECNFVGCAMGWMPKIVPECPLVTSTRSAPRYTDQHGNTYYDYVAIARYFEIPGGDAHQLFSPVSSDYTEDDSPSAVAENIIRYLKSKGVNVDEATAGG